MPDPWLNASACPARRGVLVAVLVLLALSLPAVARADDLPVRYSVDKGSGTSMRVTGTVTNEGRVDVLDVYVTAEALDASGKVLGRGVSFVSQSILQRASATFTISVPAAQAAASFRVRVSSFRPGLGVQSS